VFFPHDPLQGVSGQYANIHIYINICILCNYVYIYKTLSGINLRITHPGWGIIPHVRTDPSMFNLRTDVKKVCLCI
jgi:hypothetical protein